MAININRVYTTVQAILNKEQRGYITPTEFNKYAEQAQLDIFEGYFYDKSHFLTSRKGVDGIQLMNLEEKMDLFMVPNAAVLADFALPNDLYRLDCVYYADGTDTRVVDFMKHSEQRRIRNSSKTAPSTTFPKYVRTGNSISVLPTTITEAQTTIDYYKRPAAPKWNYIGLGPGRQPLYNQVGSVDFEIHPSDEYILVYKLLTLSGVEIKDPNVVQFALQEEANDNTNKKS